MSIRIAISGCAGRMGCAVSSLVLKDPSFSIGGAFEAKGNPAVGKDLGSFLGVNAIGVLIGDDAKSAIEKADVLIDFTLPEATIENLKIAKQLKKAVVIGTTGLSESQQGLILEASKVIPVVFSPNMSLGVNLLFEISRSAAQKLGSSYDVEIVEAHHRAKKDSPSGTAKRLAKAIADGRSQKVEAIPVHAVRAGDIVGEHTVIFAGPFERLELTHRAHNRNVFALGALKAAQFINSQKAGLYDMSHVLKGNL